jgi:aminoglycoside N3'-acetyltransferase
MMFARDIAYRAARLLPAPVFAYLRKRHRRNVATRRQQERAVIIARHGLVDAAELLATLRQLGVSAGGVLFVQSSFNDMHTFAGKPIDLLQLLRTLVGPTGTLMMPAYSVDMPTTEAAPLELGRLPTYTGIVNELFRRSPGVLRSVHPRHSICAEGPLARELLAGHENCVYADGAGSPLDRLRRRDDALILTLGLPRGFTSFLHWIEDHEPDRLPLRVHQAQPRSYVVRHPDGRTITIDDMQVLPAVAARLDLTPVADALGPEAFRWMQHRGIDLGLYVVKPLSQCLISLRDQGIFHYH